MGTISRPGRSRHDSGRGILNFRSRDKEPVTREPVTKEKMTKEVVTKEPVTKELVTKEKVTKESVNKEKVTKEVVTKEPAVIKEIATKEIVAKDTVKGEEKVGCVNNIYTQKVSYINSEFLIRNKQNYQYFLVDKHSYLELLYHLFVLKLGHFYLTYW